MRILLQGSKKNFKDNLLVSWVAYVGVCTIADVLEGEIEAVGIVEVSWDKSTESDKSTNELSVEKESVLWHATQNTPMALGGARPLWKGQRSSNQVLGTFNKMEFNRFCHWGWLHMIQLL